MRAMGLKEIAGAIHGNILQFNQKKYEDISIDSRTIKPGALFFAIIGERFDGHSFIEQAAANGAGAVIVDRKVKLGPAIGVVKVADTTKALQELAHFYRSQLTDLKVIGITGSAGKTTTKDMIAALLRQEFLIKKTKGNLNNNYGLPLTILNLEGKEEIAILEMGMSQLGEIKLLAKIAQPEIGVITNVGETHLETLGTKENVARGKSELIAALPAEGTAVLNYDDPFVFNMKKVFSGNEIIYYGLEPDADIYAHNIKTKKENISFDLRVKRQQIKGLTLNKPGKHNLYNALAAIAVACQFGIDWSEIRTGLTQIELSSLRWEVTELAEGIKIINDTYNANPLSMRAAVDTARETATGRVITALGAMLELGVKEKKAHLELGKYLASKNIDIIITVGEIGKLIARGAIEQGSKPNKVFSCLNNQDASDLLSDILRPEDTVLIKGSRGNKMEEIVEQLIKQED